MRLELRSEMYFTGEEIMENYLEDLEDLDGIQLEYDEELDKVFLEVESLPVLFNFANLVSAELIIKCRNGNPLIILDEGL